MKATDRHKLIDRIKTLEGLTDDERSALLGLLRESKTYGLVWEDKPEEVEERLRDELPVLVEIKDRALTDAGPDAPNHILIEGDNLEALATIAYTHAGKIDVIYIDPPYNRGKKDFMYNDIYVDEDNPFKHSLWLSFMSKRLIIAKKLLSQKGIIVCHIDEHEFDALNLLLCELFGSQNSLGQIIWNKMNPKGDAHAVSYMHEYILLYCKNRESFMELEDTLIRPKKNAEKMITKGNRLFSLLGKRAVPPEIIEILKTFGFSKSSAEPFSLLYDLPLINSEFQKWLNRSDFSKGEKAYKYIHPNGRIFRSVSMAWPNKEVAPDEYWIPLKHPITGETCPLPSKGWRFPVASFERLLGNEEPIIINDNMIIKGEVVFTKKKNGQLNIPERVYWLDENMTENVPSIYEDGSSDEAMFTDMQIKFEYPKTVSVGQYILSSIYPSANVVLDFFAGSGTALHAVMAQNAEDGRKRIFIGATNNESNICDSVTYPRLSKVIRGYTKPNGEEVEGLHDNNLRYYRTDFVGRSRSTKNMRRLVHLATDMLCIKENLYTELKTFAGMPTYKNIYRYFEHCDKKMLIIYDERYVDEIVKMIASVETDAKIKVYVFSPSEDPWEANFEPVNDKVELCALPQAIYNTYKRILPKRRQKSIEPTEEEDALAISEEKEIGGLFSVEGGEE